MSRDDVFRVQHDSIPPLQEANGDQGTVNRLGFQVVTDMFTQLVLSGCAYQMQIGTEDAGVVSTGSIDDQLAWMLADQVAGYAMIPLLYEVNVGVLAGEVIAMSMIEVDKDKARYNSGGVAFSPANLNTKNPHAPSGAFYVTLTAGDADIVALAKSAVPNSVELARRTWGEDALGDSIGYPGEWDPCVYSIARRPAFVLLDVGSIVCHNGASTADMTGYGVLQFAQFDRALIV